MTNPSLFTGQIAPFDWVKIDLQAATVAQLIEKTTSEIAPGAGLNVRILKDRILSHTKLQKPALGDGLALTHIRVSGLRKPFQALVRLKSPIDINAPDNRHADLFCLLLTSEKDGPAALMTVSRLSRFLKDKDIQAFLRAAPSEQHIQSFLEQAPRRIAA